MIAVIGDADQTPSIELHRALGFRMIGTIEAVGFKFDRWLATVLMQRALGTGRYGKAVRRTPAQSTQRVTTLPARGRVAAQRQQRARRGEEQCAGM